MAEMTIPWWRRALNFALGGIRSGFGLFSRTAEPEVLAPEVVTEAEPVDTIEASLEEVIPPTNRKEETALTEPPPQPEIVAVTEAIQTEPVTKPITEPVAEVVSVMEADPELVISEAVIEAEPEAAEAEPAPEAVMEDEFVIEAQPEPVDDTTYEAVANLEPLATVTSEAVEEIKAIEPEAAEMIEAEAFVTVEPVNDPLSEPVEEVDERQIPQHESRALDSEENSLPVVAEPDAEREAGSEPLPETVEVVEAVAEPEPAPEPQPAVEPVAPVHDAEPSLVLTTPPTAEEEANQIAAEKAAAKLAARQKKLDESSEQSPFSIIVGQVYDGPLDLLLDLIRKQDIDIYDIPIATITAQFLAYVNQLKASDVDVAGEFIYTASLLIHIKSRMLLPRSGSGPEEAAEDPRRELVERLLEHERFKNAAQMLQQKQMLEAATWTNPGAREFKDDEAAEPEIAADTVDLVRIFRDILERARKRPVLDVSEDSVTVGQMIQFLGRRLAMEDKPVALRLLLSHTHSERALIAMFLALLELVRLQAILLRQDRAFSEIFIKKHTGFDAVMSEGLMSARDDWR
jgi:segregation and condensation protein A